MLYENKVSNVGERGGGCGSWIVRVNVFMKESKTSPGAKKEPKEKSFSQLLSMQPQSMLQHLIKRGPYQKIPSQRVLSRQNEK